MHLNGERYDQEHIIHLIREIDHLKTELRPHDTGHIYTTISTLERRVQELMSKHENKTNKVDSSPLAGLSEWN